MKRRKFSKLAFGAAAFALPILRTDAMAPKRKIRASVLKPGDTIGLISPGSTASNAQESEAIAQIESLGFKVKLGEHLGARYGYVGGTDAERLADLHAMYADPNVAGIWCVRGGYGCSRILPDIDYKLIKKNPKVLLGYSDITALLIAIYQKTGLIGFHGPNAQPTMPEYSINAFKQMLMTTHSEIEIPVYQKQATDQYAAMEVLKSGRSSGTLIGGNLSLLAAMAGTDFAMDAKDKIVFIEDVGEKPYRIDRMLTQLLQSSNLAEAAGIVLGQFKNCEAKDLNTSLSLMDCLKDRLGHLNVPMLFGFSVGHIAHQCIMPIGAKVELDSASKQLKVIESVVQ